MSSQPPSYPLSGSAPTLLDQIKDMNRHKLKQVSNPPTQEEIVAAYQVIAQGQPLGFNFQEHEAFMTVVEHMRENYPDEYPATAGGNSASINAPNSQPSSRAAIPTLRLPTYESVQPPLANQAATPAHDPLSCQENQKQNSPHTPRLSQTIPTLRLSLPKPQSSTQPTESCEDSSPYSSTQRNPVQRPQAAYVPKYKMVDTRRRKFHPDGTIEKLPSALVPIIQATDYMPYAQLLPMTKAQLEILAAAHKANPLFDVDSPHFVGFDELGRIAQYSNTQASAGQYGVNSSSFGTSSSGMGSVGMGSSRLGQPTNTPRQFSTSASTKNCSDDRGQFAFDPSDIGQSMNNPRRFSKYPSSTGNFDVQQPNNDMPFDRNQLPPMNIQFGQLPFPPSLCFNMTNVLSDGPAENPTNDEGDDLLATISADTAERHSRIMTNTTSDLGGLLQTHLQAGPDQDPELERRMKLVKKIEESLKAAKPVVSEGSAGSRIDEDKLACRTSFCGNFVFEEEYNVGARYCQYCEASTNTFDSLFQSIHEENEREGYYNDDVEAAWARAAALPRRSNPLREFAMEKEK